MFEAVAVKIMDMGIQDNHNISFFYVLAINIFIYFTHMQIF